MQHAYVHRSEISKLEPKKTLRAFAPCQALGKGQHRYVRVSTTNRSHAE
jgi:hypothetical protein